MLKKLTIKNRILLGFGILIFITFFVALVAFNSTSTASNGFNDYRNIARTTNIIGRIQANILKLRMNAKNFQIDSNKQYLDEYKKIVTLLKALINEGINEITAHEEKRELKLVEKGLNEYISNFKKIIDYREKRDNYLYKVLGIHGPLMEKITTDILKFVDLKNTDATTFHSALVLKHLLLARLYKSHFLDKNDKTAVNQVHKEFRKMQIQLDILARSLKDSKLIKMQNNIRKSKNIYLETFNSLVELIENRNSIKKNILDRIGPEIATSIQTMKRSVKDRQDTLGPALQSSNVMTIQIIAIIGIAALFIGLFFSTIITLSITKPIASITKTALALSKGNVNLSIDLDSKDEIGLLAKSFKRIVNSQKEKADAAEKIADGDYGISVSVLSENDLLGKSMTSMRDALKKREEDLKEINLELEDRVKSRTKALAKSNSELEGRNKYISDSIDYAQKIQSSILPSETYFKQIFPNYFLIFKPKDIVSGDFYWVSQVGDIKIVAAVDCTGHGVPGALMSMIGNTLLNEIVNLSKITNPAEILNKLNTRVIEDLHKDINQGTYDGMDATICVIDEKNKTLEYSGAYRPLNYFKDGNFFEIKGDRKSIGDIKKGRINFTTKKIELNESVILYLYSDGYVDQHNEQNNKFGSKRFKKLLSNIHTSSIDKQKGILLDELKSHKGNEIQRDDITILGIKPILPANGLDEVLFNFDGEFTYSKIIEISEEVKNKLEGKFDNKIVRTIHFCGNELIQNIGFYSEEKNKSGIGSYSIVFNQSQNSITLLSSNLSTNNSIKDFTNRLDNYNSLNLDELKLLYKEKLKSESHKGSKGAGIGLIQILRKTKNKIDYIAKIENSTLSLIALKIKITIT